jgi:oligopeptide transport system substrate-binding protein
MLDPNYFLELWLHSKSALNRVNYANPAFDALLDQANATPDRAKRIALVQQADQLVARDVPLIPIMYTRFVYLTSPRVKGLEVVPLSLGFGPFRAVEVSR